MIRPVDLHAATSLSIKDNGASAGYVTLGWDVENPDAISTIETKPANKKDAPWRQLYQGPDTATTLSGLEGGDYLFRLKVGEGDWSEPLEFTVSHHALSKALAFFGVGLVLFLALLMLLFSSPGAKTTKRA